MWWSPLFMVVIEVVEVVKVVVVVLRLYDSKT
jgi:hypothetical protein